MTFEIGRITLIDAFKKEIKGETEGEVFDQVKYGNMQLEWGAGGPGLEATLKGSSSDGGKWIVYYDHEGDPEPPIGPGTKGNYNVEVVWTIPTLYGGGTFKSTNGPTVEVDIPASK